MGFLNWLLGGAGKSDQTQPASAAPPADSSRGAANQMNEGDYHSGPAGYSPNTAYPETQYGSGFDEGAAWHEGES